MNKPNSDVWMIKNVSELLSHGQTKVREDALRITQAGIRGADPGHGTRKLLKLEGNRLKIGEHSMDLNQVDHIYVVGSGKGSFPIAEALEEILGSRISGGVLVVKKGETRRLQRIEVHEAGHPIPTDESVEGAQKIMDLVEKAGERDLVFAAVTGGSSALTTLPPAGIRLAEVQELNDILLKSGAVIREMNIVRRHLCRIKGGGLVAKIQPAQALTLTLDTAPEGMPWPDMCLADPATFQEAIAVLKQYKLWKRVSPSIRAYLEKGTTHPELETVKSLAGMRASIYSVGDPLGACEAAAECARGLGYQSFILSTNIEGEAKDLGIFFAGLAKEVVKRNRPFPTPCALISGGETTVTIGEECGAGGPNQELVLGFVKKFHSTREVACVSVDTDGTDGPTQIAGGIADGTSGEWAQKLGFNLDDYIMKHNSSAVLEKMGDTIVTGHTGTNVMNLRVLLIK